MRLYWGNPSTKRIDDVESLPDREGSGGSSVTTILRSAVVAWLLSAVPVLAQNQDGNSQGGNSQGGNSQGGGTSGAHWVPEFDPATAGVIAAIVAGGGVLLARRRRR